MRPKNGALSAERLGVLDILAIAGAVLGVDINFLMISLLALTEPRERQEIVIN